MTPNLSSFLELAAKFSLVPVSTEVLLDRDTPVSVFEKLVGDREGFLLESVEGGEQWAHWSFVGWDPLFTLTSLDGASALQGDDGLVPPGDPLAVLEAILSRFQTPDLPHLPPLFSGAVGYLGFDCIRYIENLPNPPPDDRRLPESLWQFVGSLAAIDRFRQTATLVRNVVIGERTEDQYHKAVRELEAAAHRLGSPRNYRVTGLAAAPSDPRVESTMDRATFLAAVEKIKQYITNGDAYQIVVSQRLETELAVDPFHVYRALRVINPSPFLFFLRHPSVTVLGSSPELMSRVRDGIVYSRPIAGTRPRGAHEDADRALEKELLADPKERAEHVMLVDLARNDLGRVCEYGSVAVDDLMVVERYSHVMHLVSGVSGNLAPGKGPVDVLRAVFPHGTVSGAPKVRAIEIIDELEPVRRGPYAGALGYIDFSGNLDTAICLRTIVAAAGKAWVQAGAGVVADSDPALEYEETMHKAAAALEAIAQASHVG